MSLTRTEDPERAQLQHELGSGPAPALVYVHGYGGSLHDWDALPISAELPFARIACDLPGHGNSAGGELEVTIERCARDVGRLVRDLGLGPAVLVGHSLGTRVVLELARVDTEITAAVVLVDGSSDAVNATPTHIGADGLDEHVRAAFGQMFSVDFDRGRAAAIIDQALQVDPSLAVGLLANCFAWDRRDLTLVLSQLTVPVLAVQSTTMDSHGRRRSIDAGEMSPYLQILRAHRPDVRIEWVEASGHFPMLERPEALATAIANFVKTTV